MKDVKLALTRSQFLERYFYLDMDQPFSLEDRDYLRPIYDTKDQTMILYFGRQSEKTVQEDACVIDEYGIRVPIKDIKVGDRVATMLHDGSHMGSSTVLWKSERYRKRCVKITTQMGHILDVGYTHPIRQWNRWTVADNLKAGDRVATIRGIRSEHSDDNRDTYPIELNQDIQELYDNIFHGHDLICDGELMKTLRYPLSRNKLTEYVSYFRKCSILYKKQIDQLEHHISTDLYWDKVVSVENIGDQWCYDLEIQGTNNYAVDGVITHNSTTIANKILMHSIEKRRFRTVYISSADAQAQDFSKDKLASKLKYTPLLSKCFWGDPPESDNVYTKELKNGSRVLIRSILKSPDRVRGISADLICFDELQDIDPDFIPVAEECISHSKYKYRLYAGTPDTAMDALDQTWSFSDQTEYVFRCSAGHWNEQDSDIIARITPLGIECKKCKRILEKTSGGWVIKNPQGRYKGYRTSQLMVPWISPSEILDKRDRYSAKRFYNEVVALPYDAIGSPVSETDIRKCCDENMTMIKQGVNFQSPVPVFAGVDWGSGSVSYTVISFWAYLADKWTLLRAKRFSGIESDPHIQQKAIMQELYNMKPTRVGCDWGFGYIQNAQLKMKYTAGEISEIYNTATSNPVSLDKAAGMFKINRSYMMSRVFNMILEEKVRFPRWEDFQPFAKDILSIRIDDPDKKEGMKQLKYIRVGPDDYFHSMMYGVLMGELQTGRMMISTI